MNSKTLTTVIIILIVGFSGGFLVGSRRPAPATANARADAEAALAELVAYRGTGARAARTVIDLVDRIAAGGEALVSPIDALLSGPSDGKPGHLSRQRYVSSGDQAPGVIEMDTLKGILSRHSTARIALLEVLDRIGGDAAIAILIREAERGGREATSMERVVSILFLAKRGDRPAVRQFLNRMTAKALTTHKSDWEAARLLEVGARYLDEEMWVRLSGAFQEGWASDALENEIAFALVILDETRAAELFLSMVAEVTQPVPLRIAAARAIARMPAWWESAVALVLRDADPSVIGGFVWGLQHGRWDEQRVLWRDARESGDPERLRAYERERLPLLEGSLAILRRFEQAVGPEMAARLDLPKRVGEFTVLIDKLRVKYGE